MKRWTSFVWASFVFLLPVFLQTSMALGQMGPHRKVFTTAINCHSVSANIVEAKTNGQIDFFTHPTVVLTKPIVTNDIILAVAVNNGGTAVAPPTLSDTQGQTWNPLLVQDNEAIWYAQSSGSFSSDSITVVFAVQSNRSLTVAHFTGIPSFIAAGAPGTFPSVPTFSINASNIAFNYADPSAGSSWVFGGIGVPSSATAGSGLVLAAIASYNGTAFNPPFYPPSPWINIVQSGLPSAAIAYSCA